MTQPVPIRAQQAERPERVHPMQRIYKPGAQPGGKFTVCIFGKPGVGKTTLVSTMPGRGLLIDVEHMEGGTFVLGQHADRIDVVPIDAWDEIDLIFKSLRDGQHDYRWLAIDSITAFQELAKRKTVRERDLNMDPALISKQDWGKVGRLVGELIYKLKGLNMHTIYVAQERRRQDEDGGTMQVSPEVSPSALSMLIPSMTMVGRLSVEPSANGWERHLRVGTHDLYLTKIRALPRVNEKPYPSVVRNPNLGHMLAYALGADVPRPDEVEESGVVLG